MPWPYRRRIALTIIKAAAIPNPTNKIAENAIKKRAIDWSRLTVAWIGGSVATSTDKRSFSVTKYLPGDPIARSISLASCTSRVNTTRRPLYQVAALVSVRPCT
jgi:hypothetical protein